MITAWVITLPAAGLVAAGAFELSDAIGGGWGGLAVGVAGAAVAGLVCVALLVLGIWAMTQKS